MNKHIGSKFDDFLKGEKIFDEAEAIAIKKVFAYQIQKAIGKKHFTKIPNGKNNMIMIIITVF